MPKTTLALVIHFHQPVGNLDEVVRRATERCYRPFLETLAEFPDLPATLHYSGCLLEWLEANDADLTTLLRELSERGQIELMTGGFYEPVLAALPHRDRVGQIEMLTRHLKERYLGAPSGAWLTERVWEQDVIPALIDAGVRYTVVDDTMFHSVGVTDDELTGPFVTEHDGRPLLVYAGDRNLRYLIPYKRHDRVFEHLRSSEPGRIFVYADDGEKFGEWPDTHERVYGKGWLKTFFSRLLDESDWLSLETLGSHAARSAPRGRVYLPSSSYDEMMVWALPTEARLTVGKLRRTLAERDPDGALPFVKGAPWRAFLAKYPEVNQLQKRMLHVSNLLAESAPDNEVARRELYRAQCNCAYWHGAFGGVYLSFMRGALWHHLMRAEGAIAAEAGPAVRALDVDADGHDEIFIGAPWGAAIVAPHRGGALVELDDWRQGANLLAVVARHREAYHLEDENPPAGDSEEDEDEMEAVSARAEMGRDSLSFDDHPRGALIDVVDGHRLVQPYEHEVDAGGMARLSGAHGGLKIEKTLTPDADGLVVAYTVTNVSGRPWQGTFGVESSVMPLNLGRDNEGDTVETYEHGWRVTQREAEVYLEVDLSTAGRTTAEPLETASATLEGLQGMKQGSVVTTTWDLDLETGASFQMEMRWRAVVNDSALTKSERGVSAGL